MGCRGWGLLGVVGLLACGGERTREEDTAAPRPPPVVVEQPSPPPPPVEEQKPPPPPARNPLLDEVVQSEGACGRSERVHLSPASLGRVRFASPGAQLLGLGSDAPAYRELVFHVPSGRMTAAPGEAVAFSPDERRVLLWDAWNTQRTGLVREVDAAKGTARVLIADPVSMPYPRLFPSQVWMWTEDRRTFRYLLEDGRLEQLSGPSARYFWSTTSPGYPPRALLADGMGFVVWDEASGQRWTVEQAEGALLLEDGSGAVYVDAAGTAWGWTPQRPAVQLGRYGTVYGNSIWLRTRSPSPSGELLVALGQWGAVRWNVRTGAVTPVAQEMAWAAPSPAGTRLLLSRTLPEGGQALVVREVADGSERTVLRGSERVNGTWSPDGGHIVAREYATDDRGFEYFTVRLFRSVDLQEVVLQPSVGASADRDVGLYFVDGGRVLHVLSESYNAFYSTVDGSRRYGTSRATAPAEGHYFYWGPDGVFYGQYGAYGGPPDQGLFAWNPRTGVETELGVGTQAVCFLGKFHLFQHNLPPRWYEPGPLSTWVSATGERQLLSSHANRPVCTQRHAGVVFQEGLSEETGWKAPLVFASPARTCRQTLAEDVEAVWALDDSVLLSTSTGVWRASYPAP